MTTRKSMTFPIIITFIIIAIIVYLFTTIKQTEIVCSKTYSFDSNIRLQEDVTTTLDGKKITSISVVKTILLPEDYADEVHLNSIKFSLDKTLEYLGKKVNYTISNDRIIVEIKVDKNEVLLLDNIEFVVNDDLQIVIDTNTKSSNVITLTVGDNYTDGEFMKRLKNKGYRCK